MNSRPGAPIVAVVRRDDEVVRKFGEPHALHRAEQYASDAQASGEAEADQLRNQRS